MNVPENSKPDQAGFTLIEALLAMVILAFGLIAITNLLIVAASSNSVGNMSSAATALASQQLELLKAQSYTNIAPGGSLTADQSVAGVPYFRDDSIDGVAVFHTRWQIVQIAGDQQTRFIHVHTEPAPGLFRSRAAADFTTHSRITAKASARSTTSPSPSACSSSAVSRAPPSSISTFITATAPPSSSSRIRGSSPSRCTSSTTIRCGSRRARWTSGCRTARAMTRT